MKQEDGLIAEVVAALTTDKSGARGWQTLPVKHHPPSRDSVIGMTEDIRSVLFPGYFGPTDLGGEALRIELASTLHRVRKTLEEQVKRGLCFRCSDDKHPCPESNCDCDTRASDITRTFISRIPAIRALLVTDVQAAFEGDPAAPGVEETVFCYPGVFAVTNYRIAHELHMLGVLLIPRIITEHAHSLTGIDIHPGARIGESFFIDHGTGVVIGETSIIGKRVRIYQGVTLGAKSFPLDAAGQPIKGIDRHPIVEDDVTIYAGATILGRITIGCGATVGGNAWITQDVPPGTKMLQKQAVFADEEKSL